jgi:hypothetical protein
MINELNAYLEAIKIDYRKWSTYRDGSISQSILDAAIVRFEAGLKVVETQLYYKVIKEGSGVHSFIVKEDGLKFKKGDILKAATFKAPAKNQARGNLFTGYRIRWTGAEYLR